MFSDGELFKNEYITVTLEHGGRVVRILRSAVAYPNPETAEQAYLGLYPVLDLLGRSGRCLLNDQRLAIGRNEPEYEAAFARIRSRTTPGFRKIATLVRSKVGKLQLHRMIREDRIERLASDSEAEILQYFGLGGS
jgi:hypothetical protein